MILIIQVTLSPLLLSLPHSFLPALSSPLPPLLASPHSLLVSRFSIPPPSFTPSLVPIISPWFPYTSLATDRLAQLAEIDRKGEEKKAILAKELERTEKLLSATYDKYA